MMRQKTVVHITTDFGKLLQCESIRNGPPEVMEGLKAWRGEPVTVFLPPLPKPIGTGDVCSSKFFWQIADDVVENKEGAACFCEHMLDID